MKQLKQQFVDSWHELRKTKVMAVAAMLIAIGVILGFFSVQLTEFIRMVFPVFLMSWHRCCSVRWLAGIMGGIGDILKFLIKPTGPYFFGYTLNAMLGPVIYGIFFYHRPIQLGRVVAAKITVALLVNLLLGTWWLTILYGKGFLAILPARFIKQVVSVPIDSVIFYVLAKTLERSKAISMIKKIKRAFQLRCKKRMLKGSF